MSPEAIPFIFIFFIIIAILFRLAAGSFDGDRVKGYIENTLGGELIDQSWAPFGPGWYGEKDSRIYEIIYKDRAGATHRANVKTSMLSGVYLTNDTIIEQPAVAQSTVRRSLDEEAEALKARLREIEDLKERG
ncbi:MULTISPECIES: hypothetical protein [unclassified Lentimonas]|uniref:hypothetical protein n=1 Tax=unclassified Lentimonas TaxID=2630993 RepID=UPI001326078B|nr:MULTISPECIES: hypothetical protein [unclassified Lentimonas]CAA6678148.1 Unannotated [Lentimonas sp. CC4]CAA6685963.1 Unannotated [Lentimonas sp. CC6]CAA6691840.1 Unannotated [Lentimonas sp. CC19]CAA6694588.1 Unannotated [Lentimonas sp. CC10]CAA7072121.1 Unannotated [Lentimonas sp. CC11]